MTNKERADKTILDLSKENAQVKADSVKWYAAYEELNTKNKILVEALENIKRNYDNVEDLAGAISKQALNKVNL